MQSDSGSPLPWRRGRGAPSAFRARRRSEGRPPEYRIRPCGMGSAGDQHRRPRPFSGELPLAQIRVAAGQAFDVRDRIEADLFPVGSGKYEVTGVAENHRARVEAVDTIWLVPSRSDEHGVVVLQSGGTWDTTVAGYEVPPNRSFRRTYDLLAQRYGPIPSEITAVVELESGTRSSGARRRHSTLR